MKQLLKDYAVPAGHYDELLDERGALRSHWRTFAEHAGALGPESLNRVQARVARQLHDDGVSYNVHAPGPSSPARGWALDVLPHIMPASEWEPLAAGLQQRARLLEAIAADLYGEQRLLGEALIPPPVVFGHRGFLRACHGVPPPAGVHLHLVAF